MKMKKKMMGILATLFFTLVSIVFVAPIFIVLINSMKSKTFINLETFKLPTEESYVGLENYKTAITQYDFLKALQFQAQSISFLSHVLHSNIQHLNADVARR